MKYVVLLALFISVLFIPLTSKTIFAQNACIVGDANGDGKVSLADFETWRRAYISTPATTNCPSGAVQITPGQDLEGIVSAQPENTSFCIKAGVYREQMVTVKTGDSFVGEGVGTILNGSRELTNFQSEGPLWHADGQTQEGQIHGECDKVARCGYPEDLFINDIAQIHVADKASVKPGSWFFDYPADRIYIGDSPAGKKVETSTTRHAFTGVGMNNISIKNLIVEKYANPAQYGAINSGDFSGPAANNWMVDNVIVRLNHGTGISFFNNSNSTIQNSKAIYNQQKGLGVGGTNNSVLNNELAFNNPLQAFRTGWEAGGSKFANTDGLLVKDNIVHDNNGPGLWTDIDNINTTYDHNTVTNNTEMGIFHEISYKATIKNNIVKGNGFSGAGWCYGAGILVSASRDVEVFGNTVQGNYHSIIGMQQQRGVGAFGAHETRNLNVHDNQIQAGPKHNAETGVCEDYAAGTSTPAWNNTFDKNSYYGPDAHWAWDSREIADFSQWQATGNDKNGTLTLP